MAVLPLARERGGRAHEGFQGLGALGRPTTGGRSPRHASVVLIVDEVAAAPPTLAQRAKAWGLTPAERVLLESLLRGMKVVVYAATAGIRESTARFHVRSLLQKSGAQRLSVLVRLCRVH